MGGVERVGIGGEPADRGQPDRGARDRTAGLPGRESRGPGDRVGNGQNRDVSLGQVGGEPS